MASQDQETRIQQAVEAIRNKQIASVRQAAILYSVPRSTLQGRLAGTRSHAEAKEPFQRLTAAEEDSIVKAVLQMQVWGWPVTVESLENFASRIMKGRDDHIPLGGNWHKNFKNRHPEIKLKKSRHPDQQRRDGATYETLSQWFESYRRSLLVYAIAGQDLYCVAEKGIEKSIDYARVFIPRPDKDTNSNQNTQPPDGECLSITECVSMNGFILPPFITFSGQQLQESWLDPAMNQETVIKTSPSGWMDQNIALAWLQHFDEKTKDQRQGLYRAIILDGHSCYESVDFVQYCDQHYIVPLCLPSHTTHVLHPLDVGVFGPLGDAYKQIVSQQQEANAGALRAENRQCLLTYQEARQCIARYIPSAWKDVGLRPFCPSSVLSNYRLKTPPFISITNQDGQRVDFPIDGTAASMINNFVEQLMENLNEYLIATHKQLPHCQAEATWLDETKHDEALRDRVESPT